MQILIAHHCMVAMVWLVPFWSKAAFGAVLTGFLKQARQLHIPCAMETIAITYWNGIISPMFDASCCLLIVGPDGQRCFVDAKDMSLVEKVERCSSESVKVVICGAISNFALAMLKDRGIRVFPWVRGSAEEVIRAYADNLDLLELFSMPGCNRKHCGRRRKFRNHGGVM